MFNIIIIIIIIIITTTITTFRLQESFETIFIFIFLTVALSSHQPFGRYIFNYHPRMQLVKVTLVLTTNSSLCALTLMPQSQGVESQRNNTQACLLTLPLHL